MVVPPISNPLNLSLPSSASSQVAGQTGLDLIQPVITLGFGNSDGGSSTGDIASNVVRNLANQTRAITSKGTILGDLGITPNVLLAVTVSLGIAGVFLIFK